MDKAKELIDIIDGLGGVSSYKETTNARNAWNAAFILYKRENPNSRMRKGCDSCREKIYNWLRDY